MAKKSEVLIKCDLPMDGEVIPSIVAGKLDRTYHGREVVSCILPPGLFGTKSKRARHLICTLHNGLLNQCSIRGNIPSPYWAILDAAIGLKAQGGFKRQDVISAAVRIVGEGKRKACEMAFDVTLNHHRHARRRDAAGTYMIQKDNKEKGKLMIRARDPSETLQYFEAQLSRKRESEAIVAAQVAEVAGG